MLIERHSAFDLFLRRMPLGNAADQLEWAKGIKPLAAVFPDFPAMLFIGDFTHGFQKIALRRAVGVDVENILSLGEMRIRKRDDLLGESAVVNAGSKADALLSRQISVWLRRHINERHGMLFSDGIQQLFCVAVMLGIVNDGRAHFSSVLLIHSSSSPSYRSNPPILLTWR